MLVKLYFIIVLLQVSHLQQEQMKVGALTKETELLKHSIKQLKGQVHQLQELLANREQEHRYELFCLQT